MNTIIKTNVYSMDDELPSMSAGMLFTDTVLVITCPECNQPHRVPRSKPLLDQPQKDVELSTECPHCNHQFDYLKLINIHDGIAQFRSFEDCQVKTNFC